MASHLLLIRFSLCNHILSDLFTKRLRARSAFNVKAQRQNLAPWLRSLVDAQLAGVTSIARNRGYIHKG